MNWNCTQKQFLSGTFLASGPALVAARHAARFLARDVEAPYDFSVCSGFWSDLIPRRMKKEIAVPGLSRFARRPARDQANRHPATVNAVWRFLPWLA